MIKDCNVGIKALLVVDGKCLIVKRVEPTHEYWDVPGGRIDNDETLSETLARELKEELPSLVSYTIRDVVGAYRFRRNITNNRALVLIFYKVEAEPFDVVLSDEHTEYLWIGRENIALLNERSFPIEPNLRILIEKVLS
jgi:8-oxo-dGTP diphosphatase